MIPHRLWRTVPAETSSAVERWWTSSVEIHPHWEHFTLREPIDPSDFPISSKYWHKCRHGAQKAGLIRLETILSHGGVYIDSDVELYRPLDSLTSLQMFAAWEDPRCVPDAIFGAEKGHPAVAEMLYLACLLVDMGRDPWDSGPGVFTDILPNREDVTLFPPGTLYPYHYSEKNNPAVRNRPYGYEWPWCYAVHHWSGSWVT